MFSHPTDKEELSKRIVDEQQLEKVLNAQIAKGNYNLTARIAAGAPQQYDAFIMTWIQQNITELPAPFFYVMSRKLDATDNKAALRWYTRGYVLAMVDRKLCIDKSARQGIEYLNYILGDELKQNIGSYQESGLIYQERVAAIEYAGTLKQNYDPMWICSHGVSTFTEEGNSGFEPLEKRKDKLDELAQSLPKK
ncbi:hypothetical protein [Pseudodesulfovibrio sediminis]|nr:hypothetical protein [Pseudodesulfovibrio sediminis]